MEFQQSISRRLTTREAFAILFPTSATKSFQRSDNLFTAPHSSLDDESFKLQIRAAVVDLLFEAISNCQGVDR